MDVELIWDLDSFLKRLEALREKGVVFGIYKNNLYVEELSALKELEKERKEPLLISEDNEDNYYEKVKVCKMILLDIKNGGSFYEKLIKTIPGISHIKYDYIKRIDFDEDNKYFYIKTKDEKEFILEEEDLLTVYDKFYRSPDLFDFETIYYGDKIFSCHKYSDVECSKVFEVKEES
ncbi:MAG: hypothetical protein GKC00_04225 [Candidatus Methanofastidiosa archaeon]|nr:hypothetical protein [Candidatus Methanofastidiosa archaeon]